jgi:hypothetical protein
MASPEKMRWPHKGHNGDLLGCEISKIPLPPRLDRATRSAWDSSYGTPVFNLRRGDGSPPSLRAYLVLVPEEGVVPGSKARSGEFPQGAVTTRLPSLEREASS